MYVFFNSPNAFLINLLKQNKKRSVVIDEDSLWTFPIPYVLDEGLGKYTFSCIITQNICGC